LTNALVSTVIQPPNQVLQFLQVNVEQAAFTYSTCQHQQKICYNEARRLLAAFCASLRHFVTD